MSANNSIVKCSHCNSILSIENFNKHDCNLELKACKGIDVISITDDSYKGKKLMSGWGTDGILYTFEVVPRKAIPITLPLADEFLQRKEDRRRLDRTTTFLLYRGRGVSAEQQKACYVGFQRSL